jgi:hypothetical protein
MKVFSIRQQVTVPERLACSFVKLVNPQTGLRDQRYEREYILKFRETFGPYRGKSALPSWETPEFFVAQNRDFPKAPLNDIGQMAGIPIISERTRTIVSKFLEADAELLPILGNKIEIKGKMKPLNETLKFYIVHHLQKRDCLDLEALGEDPNNDYISYLEKYEFRPEALENAHFFQIKHHPGYFASETFIQLLEQHDLRGMVWELIWDSENPDYVDERFKPEVWAEIKARKAKK